MDEAFFDRVIQKFLEENRPSPPKAMDEVIFNTACSFHTAGIRCSTEIKNLDGTKSMPMSPTIACYAFACELYIKALLPLGTRGHNLSELFEKLADDIKRLAYNNYLILVPNRSESAFRADLNLLSNAFVEWRYIFESAGVAISLHRLIALTWGLHGTLRVMGPQWSVQSDQSSQLTAIPDLEKFRLISLGGGRTALLRAVSNSITKGEEKYGDR
jgi:hypothetical protein